ncbi:hypothetical protein DPQ33_05725 [Oceanidesulfovibrio indonesiensis]|uniref:FlgO domain-containing protein n=1 Tax=Oceanidesulfovibrio indonesiensis TaxID=54767 RepID=A0A7M3MG05_9BACT|nr:FlgO family outer membrane protein [Oceanidesulfovibrio indonesiensis]TVM18253.1 hypothetical protein DPQ33_05725 [Oceanidesulfovibrio indonesiensis]
MQLVIRILSIFLIATALALYAVAAFAQVGAQPVPTDSVPMVEPPLAVESVSPQPPAADSQQAARIAHQYLDQGAAMGVGKAQKGVVSGQETHILPMEDMYSGTMVPDGRGGYVWMGPRQPMVPQDPDNVAARELKLIIKELADQLAEGPIAPGVTATMALPTSFVSQDNFDETSSFGRYFGEQMIYEFVRRGYQVNEYRLDSAINSRPGQGDFLLSRRVAGPSRQHRGMAILVGTYYADRQNVFVNARLVEATTGRVLRAGNVVFPQTLVSKQMLANTTRTLEQEFVNLRDYDTMVGRSNLTDIDKGFDIR